MTLLKARARFALLVAALLGAFMGCSSTGSQEAQAYGPRIKWYAHCESCNWCKGAFKSSDEAQSIVSEHNIRLHDWIKVAYYDTRDCSQ